jgi:hypothetical protein
MAVQHQLDLRHEPGRLGQPGSGYLWRLEAGLTDWLNGDIGVLHYAYPGSYPDGMTKPDTTEVYLGLDAAIAFKYSYSTGNTFGNAAPAAAPMPT